MPTYVLLHTTDQNHLAYRQCWDCFVLTGFDCQTTDGGENIQVSDVPHQYSRGDVNYYKEYYLLLAVYERRRNPKED